MTSRRSGLLPIRATILALGLTVSLGAGFAQAHDPRLDEAFLALQKAEALVKAALGANELPPNGEKKYDRRLERECSASSSASWSRSRPPRTSPTTPSAPSSMLEKHGSDRAPVPTLKSNEEARMRGDDRHPDAIVQLRGANNGSRRCTPCGDPVPWCDTALRNSSQIRPADPKTGRPSIRAREAAPGPAAADALLRAEQRQLSDAARLQPATSAGSSASTSMTWSGTDRIHQESRSGCSAADIARPLGTGAGPAPGHADPVGRALHGRRDVDRGVGRAEELQEEGDRRAYG